MIESIVSLLTAINSVSPIGIAVLLAIIIYMMIKQKSETDTKLVSISDNHLSGLPEMMETMRRMEVTLERLDAFLRARLNHHDR